MSLVCVYSKYNRVTMALSVCLWNEGLADDIYHVLRNKEQNLPFYFAQSPELHLRRKLVDWLASMWDASVAFIALVLHSVSHSKMV